MSNDKKEVIIPERDSRKMWTTAQLAAATQNAELVVTRWCRLKAIPSQKVGGEWRISAQTANAILDGKVAV